MRAAPTNDRPPAALWRAGLPLVLAVIVVMYLLQRGMAGPPFLGVYGILMLVLFFLVHTIRTYHDSDVVNYLALIAFVGSGVARMVWGLSHGMHRFGYLVLMMVAGGVLLVLRAEAIDNFMESTRRPGRAGDGVMMGCGGGGGGCGGGGCGGGGCGGCGG